MRRNKAEVHKYIEAAQSSAASPREKSMKGFLFAKLYYEAKEYDLAKRCVSSYINVQERDPKAHKFLGHLFEIEGNVEKAVGCYKRSVELNPTQKDLILKIAELMCTLNVVDGRATYWVERASKLFPGSPVIFRLKEQLLNSQDDAGSNQLFNLIQSELFSRPDDVFVNIRLVQLYRSVKRLDEAVSYCLKPERRALRCNLEWSSCVVQVLKEYLAVHERPGSDKCKWRTISKELLIAHANVVVLTLSTRDVQDSKGALESFDQALLSVKHHVGDTDTDDLSMTFVEMRGHYYMHAGTLLLKMAQQSEVQWKALIEPATLCYLLAFKVPRPKSKPIRKHDNGQDILEGLACDRQSQSGHMLLTLSHGKPNFVNEIIETFANINGQSVLLNFLYEGYLTTENSFLGSDDIRDISHEPPDIISESRESMELCRYDYDSVRLHDGSLQHLTWLGLQWNFMGSLPTLHKWLKLLFPRLPKETKSIDAIAPESICMLDLEVFLLAVVHTSHLQLENNSHASHEQHRPHCLPLPICKQLCSERQLSWWDAIYSLLHKKALPGTSVKLRLVIQHGLNTLRALEKHGLQPALLIHWARSLYVTGNSLNSFYDQRDYMGRCVHYWKRVLPLLELIKQRRSIPEPVDPLFKHFHRVDIKISDIRALEDEAHIAFATLDLIDGKIDDAIAKFYEIKNVLSYWNLALEFQRKADEIENDALSLEEQEDAYHTYLQKSKVHLVKIIDECSEDPSAALKLPVSLDAVGEMLDSVRQKLGECAEDHSPDLRDGQSFITASRIKHSTPSPSKFNSSCSNATKFSPKTPPRWAEDQRSLLELLCHQVEALKNEVQELKMNSPNATPGRWPAEAFAGETVADAYQAPQSFYGAPLTVSTAPTPAYYGQSPAYNSQHLLRPAANITPTKTSMFALARLAPQQHMYAYQQQMHTPPTQNAAGFPQEIYGAPLRFESPATAILSPHNEEFFNYNVPTASTNPQLPEPGYFTKPTIGMQVTKSEGSKVIEFAKTSYGQSVPIEGSKPSPFLVSLQSTPTPSTFKFNSNFKSNDGDFTFSSTHGVAPPSTFTCSESLLGLLTSDKPAQDHRTKSTSFENVTDQPNLFRFGDKGFSSGNKSQNKPSAAFGQVEAFSFQNSGKSTFMPPTFGTDPKDAQNQTLESDAGSEPATEDDGPHFEPVVPLPEKVEVKTGEEDEEEMFCNRAKLFRFDADSKEWKERGIGNVKILRHRVSGKVRLLMRREQVLKICANHYINADMKLKPNAGSDKSYVWHAYDYADEKPKPEQLAIRFKTADEAAHFKVKFEEAQKLLENTESRAEASKQKNEKDPPRTSTKDSGKPTGASLAFGSQFLVKEGEWRCDVCLVLNAATADVCLSCQTPNPCKASSKKITPIQDTKANTGTFNMPASTFSVKATTTNKIVFVEPFLKSKEQWVCSKCNIKNDATVKNCITCEKTNQGKTKTEDALPSKTTPSFKNVTSTTDTFGSAFVKKAGQWDCCTCLVRNEPFAAKCISCQTPNSSSIAQAAAQTASTYKFVSPGSTAQKDFGGMFAKKQGQWDCSTCCVRNEAAALKCVSCLSPNTQDTANAPVASIQSASDFKFGLSTDRSSTQSSSLASLFSRKEGQWECSVCLITNKSLAGSCVSCQAPNPSANSGTSHTIQPSQQKSAFSIGPKSSASDPFGQAATGFKCDFSAKDFKFGISDENASAFSLKSGAKPAKEGFSFSMPPNTTFKFGIQETSKNESKPKEPLAGIKNDLLGELDGSAAKVEADSESERNPKEMGEIIIGQNSEGFSFADLAKTSADDGFAYGNTDPNFKGFSRAGEKLFTSQNGKTVQIPQIELETTDLYKTEERDDIHFEPIVQLPDKIELVTGEEDEKTLYSERVKLFRYDAEIGQWKERGVGNLKILKNEVNGKLRMLMRREQVLKVCANHWITTIMNLKPLAGSERAWMWQAYDFSDGDDKLEHLAAKFKTQDQAEAFKTKFEECQRLLLDIPLQTPHKLVDTGRTAHLIQKAEEMKSGLKDLKTFLTDKSKPLDEESINVSNAASLVREAHAERTEPTYEWDTYDMRGDALEGNLDDSVYASPLEGSPEKKNLFRFGDSTAGFSFSFEPVLSPSKSPTKLNQSRVSVGTDEESDVTQEDDRDGQYFEPVVPLPDLVEVTSGEENEQMLFCNRAKLYRFDKDANQWKERGIGDLKILQSYDTKSARLVMRRDQVLKLCANHRITSDMQLQPMKGAERAWVWTAHDFAEGEGKVECFAVRFKLQEVADSFKTSFEEAQEAQAKDCLLTPISSRDTTPKTSPCGKAAVAILEETTKERTDQLPEEDVCDISQTESDTSSLVEKSSKTLVSPPKFVFGSEVVKNIFGNEKQKPFTFGNTSTAGTLFGFSFNSSKSKSNEEPKQPPKVNQCLDFTSSGLEETSAAIQKGSTTTAQHPVASSSLTGSVLTQSMPARAKSSEAKEADGSPDVVMVFELTPTPEQRSLAEKLYLPPTFFCYKNKPGYVSDESDDDEEDFETAVKKLNGHIYEEELTGRCQHSMKETDKECVIVWEKKPTPEEKAKADSLKLPPTFFCGMNSDPEEDKENAEDFESEVRKVQTAEGFKKSETSSLSDVALVVEAVAATSHPKLEAPDYPVQEPVDLSSKTENLKQDPSSQGFANINFSFGLDSGLSFADLASNNSGDYAFGGKDMNFQWANAGATVFGTKAEHPKGANQDGSDEEEVHSEEVDFEPIVSLPEVEVKSGEEEEEILFKERTKLYRWDRDANQWKERGVGEIKVLFHSEKNYYRVLMRRDQVLKVCANHVISKNIKLSPLNTSNNTLVWTAMDYSDGEGRIEQLAARFKTQELADSFQKKFEECQDKLPEIQGES